MVASNDREAVRAATQYLIGEGHRRIGLVLGPHGFRSARERRLGFEDALKSADIALPLSLIADGNYTFESGIFPAHPLLDLFPPPSAIFSCHHLLPSALFHSPLPPLLLFPPPLFSSSLSFLFFF